MWASIRYTFKTAIYGSLLVCLLWVVLNNRATNEFVEFIVIGEIPGSHVRLNYYEITLAASIIIGLPFLYTAIKRHWFYKLAITAYWLMLVICKLAYTLAAGIWHLGALLTPLMAQLIGRIAVVLQAGNAVDWTNPLD